MKIILYVILSMTLLSCSSIPLHDDNIIQLSDEKAYSKKSGIYLNLPNGWFTAEDNDGSNMDLWIVKNDYSASVTFKKLNLDEQTNSENAGDDLSKIDLYSRAFVKAKLGGNFDDFTIEGVFDLSGKTFSAYRYKNDKNQFVRTAVFKLYNSFFESSAVTADLSSVTELINTHNAVLSSVK